MWTYLYSLSNLLSISLFCRSLFCLLAIIFTFSTNRDSSNRFCSSLRKRFASYSPIHTYIHTHTYMQTYIHAYIHTCIHIHTYCTYVHTCIYMYIDTYICITYIDTYIYIHKYIHTHTHTYIHEIKHISYLFFPSKLPNPLDLCMLLFHLLLSLKLQAIMSVCRIDTDVCILEWLRIR